MIPPTHGRHKHTENGITVKVSRERNRLSFTLHLSVLAFRTHQEKIIGSKVGEEFGVFRGERPQKPEFSDDIDRKHSQDIPRPD